MSNQRVFIVKPGDVVGMIPSVLGWLQKMATWTRGRRTVDDIVTRILNMECVLWVTLGADYRPNGALITKVEKYPRMCMLHVLHCAGDKGHMEEVADEVYAALDAFAKFNHCSGVEFIGRPGWERHVKERGFEVRSVTYQKFFEGDDNARAR
jgi:hypothetical protein